MIARLINKYNNSSIQVKATFWFMACKILQKGFSIVTLPFFSRILTVEEYGLVTTYNAWESIVEILICLRLDYSVFSKGMSKYKENRDGYVLSMQMVTTVSSIVVALILILFPEKIATLTGLNIKLCVLLIVQGCLWPSLTFWMLRKRYEYRYKTFVFLTLLQTIGSALLSIIAVSIFNGNKGEIRIISNMILEIILGSILYIVNIKNGYGKAKIEYAKFAILFNIPLILHYLSTYVLNQSDKIMIQKMVGLEEVALYGVAYNAGMLMTIVSNSLVNAITPWYYENLEQINSKNVVNKFLPIISVVALPVLLFVLIGPEFIKVFASSKYSEAIYVIPPVSISIIYLVMYSFFSIPEFYYNANKFSAIASSIAALVNIVTNYIGINLFGYVAAGYTTMGCYLILALGHYFYARFIMKKHAQVFFNPKIILSIVVISVTYMIVVTLLYKTILVRYLLALSIIIVVIVKKDKIAKVLRLNKNDSI